MAIPVIIPYCLHCDSTSSLSSAMYATHDVNCRLPLRSSTFSFVNMFCILTIVSCEEERSLNSFCIVDLFCCTGVSRITTNRIPFDTSKLWNYV